MPEAQTSSWFAAVILAYGFFALLGTIVFLWSVPKYLSDIAHQLRRIADAKEKK